jgi:hypothetical protein
MVTGLSDAIREYARAKYVLPVVAVGKIEFEIRVRDVWEAMKAQGYEMTGRMPQVCSALQTGKFLERNDLALISIAGPPSGQSPTVVFHYKVIGAKTAMGPAESLNDIETSPTAETPEEWAHRMTGKLYGLLKDEIAGMGGTEAFIRWVRSEDDGETREDAA